VVMRVTGQNPRPLGSSVDDAVMDATGDFGFMETPGYLNIVGRIKYYV